MDADLKQTLRTAASEIRQLRQQNDVLAGQVRIVEIFAMALENGRSRTSQGMGEDIVWRIENGLREEERRAARDAAASGDPHDA